MHGQGEEEEPTIGIIVMQKSKPFQLELEKYMLENKMLQQIRIIVLMHHMFLTGKVIKVSSPIIGI